MDEIKQETNIESNPTPADDTIKGQESDAKLDGAVTDSKLDSNSIASQVSI